MKIQRLQRFSFCVFRARSGGGSRWGNPRRRWGFWRGLRLPLGAGFDSPNYFSSDFPKLENFYKNGKNYHFFQILTAGVGAGLTIIPPTGKNRSMGRFSPSTAILLYLYMIFRRFFLGAVALVRLCAPRRAFFTVFYSRVFWMQNNTCKTRAKINIHFSAYFLVLCNPERGKKRSYRRFLAHFSLLHKGLYIAQLKQLQRFQRFLCIHNLFIHSFLRISGMTLFFPKYGNPQPQYLQRFQRFVKFW